MIDAQSETADELEPQVTNQIDPSPRMCSVEKCNAKLHDMSDIVSLPNLAKRCRSNGILAANRTR